MTPATIIERAAVDGVRPDTWLVDYCSTRAGYKLSL